MSSTLTRPLVSVALCTHNGERHLREQADSLLAQREVDFEIVAVDDLSNDGTLALLQSYALQDARLRVFPNPSNLGPLRNFERAMSLCSGVFIAPSDQDDVWHPDKLASLVAAIGGADVAYCDSGYIDAQGRSTGRRISDDTAMISGSSPFRFVFANSVSAHAMLVRRSLFEAARPFPAGIYHDWWLAMCAAAGNGIAFLDRPMVGFRRHEQAISAMGRAHGKETGDSHHWLMESARRLEAHVERRLKHHERASVMLASLRRAMAGGSALPLLRDVWREPDCAPLKKQSRLYSRLRLQMRLLKKLRRARREPVPTTPRFRL